MAVQQQFKEPPYIAFQVQREIAHALAGPGRAP